MKYFIKLIICVLASLPLSAQDMYWLPAEYVDYGGCTNYTDCDQNIVCYKLMYRPSSGGFITSYTTGFFANCMDGETTVVANESCLMTDNSRQVEACYQAGIILMNCSGNSGAGTQCNVITDQPIALHQVCFQVPDGKHVSIEKDDKTDLTMSLDHETGSKTVFPSYRTYLSKNEYICDQKPDEIDITASEGGIRVTDLNWTPTRETGDGKYHIERSFDGLNFETISTITDGRFDYDKLTYELVDKEAAFGYNFYRVSYVDLSGKLVVSDIGRVFHYDGNFDIALYPNPAKDDIHLRLNAKEQAFEWTILDGTGKTIRNGNENSLSTNIDLKGLPAGSYFLKIVSETEEGSAKFLKIN